MTLVEYLDAKDPYWVQKVKKDRDSGIKLTVVLRNIINTLEDPESLEFTEHGFYLTTRSRLAKLDSVSKKTEKVKTAKIVQNFEASVTDREWDGSTSMTIGFISDTHIGSKYWQPSMLKSYYEEIARRGITDVYHAGDITDGLKMRAGHEYEVYKITADEMVDEVVNRYPCYKGVTTHFITGNHDSSIYKQIGYDIGPAISSRRPDMDYIGRDSARVNLTPNCVLELRHPWDGTAYAISYKPQKMLDALDPDTKPNIMLIGHYHKAEYIFYRNIHCFQAGCFQGQTPFTRGKGISVHNGGWIVTINVLPDGTIKSIAPEFIPFYKTAKEDYLNNC